MKKRFNIVWVFAIIIFVTFYQFKDFIFELNSTYFSSSGDGLKAYYGAIYHNKYDNDAYRLNGMNYPYGEMIFFTGSQPLIANAVRFIDHHFFKCSDKIVGIMNGFMILSILLSALFLYLIFKRLKLPDWYAVFVAIGITFLSPQIGRLGGHFSLSWVFWIPLEIYLFMLIYEKATWFRSVLFGLVTLLAGMMHMYFLAFSASLIIFFWLDQLLFRKLNRKKAIYLLHFIIQLALPVIIIHFLINRHDFVNDRTNFPWGFYGYRAYPGSIFLPVGKWYFPFISQWGFTRKYNWETIAYIGLVASSGFFVFLFKWIKRFFNRSGKSNSFTGNPLLDVMFWASFAMLLFSMGIPFIFGLEKLRTMIGALSQLRAVGRFAWLFYFVINIIVFYKLFNLWNQKKSQIFAKSVLVLSLVILLFEGWNYSNQKISRLDNKVPGLEDISNSLTQNKWLNEIKPDKYQAIMPLPYFHIGSESTWLEPKCDMAKQVFIASIKTGLPTNAVMLSRTSLSQTYKNMELTYTPWSGYSILNDFNDNRPLLLMVAHCDELNENEKLLVNHGTFLTSSEKFNIYELSIDSLKQIPNQVNYPERYQLLLREIETQVQDSSKTSIFLYRNEEPEIELTISGKWQQLFEHTFKFDPSKKIYLRFLVKNYNQDMIARTQIRIFQSSLTNTILENKFTYVWENIKSLNDEWAIIEITLEAKEPDEILKFQLRNNEISGHTIKLKDITISQIET